MDSRLKQKLLTVGRRLRLRKLGWTLAAVWFLAAIVGVILTNVQLPFSLPATPLQLWGLGTLALALVALVAVWMRRIHVDEVAKQVEEQFPTLNQKLVTATGYVQIRPAASVSFSAVSLLTHCDTISNMVGLRPLVHPVWHSLGWQTSQRSFAPDLCVWPCGIVRLRIRSRTP